MCLHHLLFSQCNSYKKVVRNLHTALIHVLANLIQNTERLLLHFKYA